MAGLNTAGVTVLYFVVSVNPGEQIQALVIC